MSHLLPNLLAVALGGALGALSRYGLANLVGTLVGRHFPWGTLTVNLVGSLIMGGMFVLVVQNEAIRREWESVLTVGFLGAFTTFSTFSLETLVMLQAGRIGAASAYVAGSVVLCVAACGLGMKLARVLA
ncbi:MAG TPA: fluoride efflux transporter CrcB [Pseudomonadales bacterium]|nr:fluoride efflux transporter CrcB [Pseudomonadales bacterium]